MIFLLKIYQKLIRHIIFNQENYIFHHLLLFYGIIKMNTNLLVQLRLKPKFPFELLYIYELL